MSATEGAWLAEAAAEAARLLRDQLKAAAAAHA